MTGALVGRDEELRLISDALARARQGCAGVVWLEGDAGAGKSTLLQRAVALASAGPTARCRVWRATCDPAETALEHGLSAQLLRRAGGAAQGPPDGGPVSTWYAERLLELAAGGEGAVVLVIDDLHWGDRSSLQMLRHLLRRLDGLPVLALLSHRPMASSWPQDLRRSLAPVESTVIGVEGLGVDDVRALAAAAGVPLTVRAATLLHEHTQGNAQLLATVLAEVPAELLTNSEGPLPAPRSFSEWVGEAFRAAGPEEQAVVAALAVLERPATFAEVAALSGAGAEAVDQAVTRRLLRHTARGAGRLVDVAHALVRSAVIELLPLAEGMRLHDLAARIVADPVQAMRHRLLACGRHDPELAQSAVELAERQAGQGALLASAQLLVLARRALPAGRQRRRLGLRAAERLTRLGEVRWASQLLAEADAERDGPRDAHELFVAGQLALQLGDGAAATEALAQVWELQQDPRLSVGAAELLAFLAWDGGAGEAAVRWSERALESAAEPGASIRFAATSLVAGWATTGSPGRARPRLEELRHRWRGTPSEADVSTALSIEAMWRSDFEAAEGYLAFELDASRGEGNEALRRASTKVVRVELDRRLGRWDNVMALARAEMASLDEGWDSRTAAMTLPVGALVAAARGDDAFASQILTRAEELLAGLPGVPGRTLMRIARGWQCAQRGDWSGAVAALYPLHEDPVARATPECVYPWRGELAEALVQVGRVDEAREVLAGASVEDLGAYGAANWLRGAAVVAVAEGALTVAEERLRAAVDLDAGPVMGTRAQLALGSLLRRQGRRRAAVELLEQAAEGAARLGAVAWTEQARRELEMSGLRRSADGEGLTPAEREVARLVVSGLTNREVAEELSVSIKTVESHLTRIFVKLGVRHRVGLVQAMEESRTGPGPIA